MRKKRRAEHSRSLLFIPSDLRCPESGVAELRAAAVNAYFNGGWETLWRRRYIIISLRRGAWWVLSVFSRSLVRPSPPPSLSSYSTLFWTPSTWCVGSGLPLPASSPLRHRSLCTSAPPSWEQNMDACFVQATCVSTRGTFSCTYVSFMDVHSPHSVVSRQWCDW